MDKQFTLSLFRLFFYFQKYHLLRWKICLGEKSIVDGDVLSKKNYFSAHISPNFATFGPDNLDP